MSQSVDLAEMKHALIEQLRRQGIKDETVLNAMGQIPREMFVPKELRHHAYDNHALSIGMDQTISQPYIVALMTQDLQLTGTERVLEIGTGSGYQTAILCRLCQGVLTIERIPELADLAKQTLLKLAMTNVQFRVGDGTLGWPEKAPFDRIVVTAAAPEVPPKLFEQLADGGIMVIPIGTEDHQVLTAVHKEGQAARRETLCDCRFVPLIGQQGWKLKE